MKAHTRHQAANIRKSFMKILILCEYGSNFHEYYISHLSKIWLEQGHQVHVSFGLNEPLPEVDIAILHVDRTIVPEEYTHALKDYPIVVNRNVTDISKSVISSYLLSVDDTYDGPVIIKTNNNFFWVQRTNIPICWPQNYRSTYMGKYNFS